MSQVSYGTITITDTNDIERIYTVYAKSAKNTVVPSAAKEDWSENVSTAPGTGNYIWQRTVVEKSGTGDKTYSSPVCLTGEEGTDGKGISSIIIKYGTSANWDTQPANWYDSTPEYSSATPNYWTQTTINYTTGNPTIKTTQDKALTQAIYDAAVANSIAQQTIEDAQGAMSQAAAAQYATEALAAKVKHYWWDSTGAHIASGINGADVTEGTASTYGFNSLVGLASMTFGYNSYKTVELDGSIPALKLYKPSKTAQGDLTATLDSNGLILSKGGVKAGTPNQSGFIYLSTEPYGSYSINGSNGISDWKEIIGTKFGVRADGTLYANNAEINGKITATSLTIGSGATVSGLSTSNINGMSNYALQSSLDSEITQRKAVYAVSTTGATTAAKTTESGTPSGFVLYNGATVTVKFNSANSTTTPTLNVNGTGAKTIKSYTGAALTAAEYTWPAGAAITFTYDGSYWRMQDGGALQAKADAAASASVASTQASNASTSATNANNAKTAAESAKTAAQTAQGAAESAKTAAQSAQSAAETASGQATTAKNDAVNAKTAAQAAQTAAETAKGQAQTAASNASQSETNAAASATAAAEVMGGFTILWNYSAFGTATAGDAFICGFDPATGTKSDGNGWVKWNGTKRTITKQQVNPGTIVPYNIPIYIVCRLSSATATTGTNYMVWYNAGWKYAACPSPTAVGGSWTWTDNRDIILGSFVETGANEVLTECELFNPPWTSKQITTNTTTPTSYIMDTNSNKGIKVRPKDSSGNDFLQMNSTAIEFFKNSTTTSAMRLTNNSFRLGLEASNHTTIDTNGLHIWTGTESTAANEVALFSSIVRIGRSDGSQAYGIFDFHSMQLKDKEGNSYFHVSDLRDDEGKYIVTFEDYDFDNDDIRIPFRGVSNIDDVLDVSITWDNDGVETTITKDFIEIVSVVEYPDTGETLIDIIVWDETHTHEIAVVDPIKATVTVKITGIYAKAYTAGLSRQGIASSLSFCEGYNNEASGAYSHAEGSNNCASGPASHAEGVSTKATWRGSHAEGDSTTANGYASHASGYSTTASGFASFACGYGTTASGFASFACGYNAKASGIQAIALGQGAEATGNYSTALGNGAKATKADIIALGRSVTVDQYGNVWHYGDGYTTTGIVTGTVTAGYVGSKVVKYGNVCQLSITCRNTSATASGKDIFTCTISEKYRPIIYTTGGSYYGSYAIGGAINTNGTLWVRNADSRSLAQMPTSNSITITFTYMVADKTP